MTDQHLQDIVSVRATINPTAIVPRQIGRTLFLTTDDELAGSGSGRIETFSSAAAVNDRFGASSEPGKAAAKYFAQPGPQPLLVARWRQTAADHRVIGGTPAALDDLDNISTGVFEFDGADFGTTSFTSATSLGDVASALQAKIRTGTGHDSLTVTYDAARGAFVITDDEEITLLSDTSSGAQIADLLGLSASTGARHLPGGTAENIEDAITDIQTIDSTWFFLTAQSSIADTAHIRSLADWATSSETILIADAHESGALTANETTSTLAQLLALDSTRVRAVWSEEEDYKSLSLAGLLASVRFAQPGSAINIVGKSLPGTTADQIGASERAELDRKGAIYYVSVGGSASVIEAPHPSGVWLDAEHFSAWLVADIQTSVWNLIRTSRRLPLTQAGLSATHDAIAQSCQRGVANGGLASGKVNDALRANIVQVTERSDFDGTLSNGYLIWVKPLDATIRAARRPEFRVWVLGSGAINRVNIDLTLEQ